jgi:hypothetical protein
MVVAEIGIALVQLLTTLAPFGAGELAVYRRFEPKRELVLAWRRSLPRGDACRNWRADCAARSLRTRS